MMSHLPLPQAWPGATTPFCGRRVWVNYPLYRDDGLPIGSGAVESACKNVAARMKRSGTTWTLAGAKHLLQLWGRTRGNSQG